MNSIIENVMNLSQRRTPKLIRIELKPFLTQLVDELNSHRKSPADINIKIHPKDCKITFDKTQLQQVVTNLCDNGLRYSLQQIGQPKLTLVGGEEYGSSAKFLDIIDYGPGVNENDQQHLFEPFYTTSKSGTGLGLYLARELCEANGASLAHVKMPQDRGCCFRINFSRHRELD